MKKIICKKCNSECKPSGHSFTVPTKKYIFDNYTATGVAEGFIETEDEDEFLAAWQYLQDTGLGYQLQGHFGRTLAQLINDGLITK